MTADERFASLETTRTSLIPWARERGIPLHRLEFVVPFVATDSRLAAWFFFDTAEELESAKDQGWPHQLETALVESLQTLGYEPTWLSAISCHFDSTKTSSGTMRGTTSISFDESSVEADWTSKA